VPVVSYLLISYYAVQFVERHQGLMAHPFLQPSAMSSKLDGDNSKQIRCVSELIPYRST